ncbi:MAG TPA: hypothetical protein ENI23_09065 [bacterium]|nr:hypothetical protein [bacterium]
MTHYAEYSIIKKKLRIPDSDDTMQNELEIYMTEIDNKINNDIRNHIGEIADDGRTIVLPLTSTTVPALDGDLTAIANDLVEGKFRLKTAEKDTLWKQAVLDLQGWLEKRFGLKEGAPLRLEPTFTASPLNGPVSTVVTMNGTIWSPTQVMTFLFAGTQVTTIPASVVTDSTGAFTGVTFTIPTSSTTGVFDILVRDGLKNRTVRFQVTP